MSAPTAMSAPLALRPYQRQAADAVISAYRRGVRRMLVQLATGLGKTVLFAHLAHTVVSNGRRVLIIAHRDELLTQARDKLLTVDPSADVGIVRAELDETDARIVVASIQTIVRPNRLARLGRFDLVVVDECHHAAARSYRDVLEALGAFEPDGPMVLGVTATPGRGDGVGLDSVFQEIVYEMGILDGIQGGYLCDLRAVSVTLDTDFSDVHTRNGDLADGELGDALIAADPQTVTRVLASQKFDRARRTPLEEGVFTRGIPQALPNIPPAAEERPPDTVPRPFVPSPEWQVVPDGFPCPPGGEFNMNLQTGVNQGRWPDRAEVAG